MDKRMTAKPEAPASAAGADVVERVAKAIYEAFPSHNRDGEPLSWEALKDIRATGIAFAQACAALAAMPQPAEAGANVVEQALAEINAFLRVSERVAGNINDISPAHLRRWRAALLSRIRGERADGWRTMESAPKDGTHFLAWCRVVADEFDEDGYLSKKGVVEEFQVVAYYCFGHFVQFPFGGGIPKNLDFVKWQPLPSPPEEGP